MKFGMFYELQMPRPWTDNAEYDTLWNAVKQVQYAEEMGFGRVWLVEHHFLTEFAHSSAPEVTLAVMAQHTKKMRLGFGVVLAPVHHPLHVAARASTLDILSDGRVDVGVGRTKGPYQLTPFGTDVAQTQSMMVETLECLPRMWCDEVFSHDGENWQIPPREVIPKPLQQPHPPLWMACTQEDTFRLAGQLGVGCLVNTLGGTDKTRGLVNAYYEAIENANPLAGLRTGRWSPPPSGSATRTMPGRGRRAPRSQRGTWSRADSGSCWNGPAWTRTRCPTSTASTCRVARCAAADRPDHQRTRSSRSRPRRRNCWLAAATAWVTPTPASASSRNSRPWASTRSCPSSRRGMPPTKR